MQQCYICSERTLRSHAYINSHFSFLKKEKRDIFQELRILSCAECGFSYAFPFIPAEVLQNFYEKDYAAQGGPHYDPVPINSHLWKKPLTPALYHKQC